MHHLTALLQRARLRRILLVGVSERKYREDLPSIRISEQLLQRGSIEVADPAGAEAERPSGGRHVLHRLRAIDVGPSRVAHILKDDDCRGRIGDEASGGAYRAHRLKAFAIAHHDELPRLQVARAHRMPPRLDDFGELVIFNGARREVALNLARRDRINGIHKVFLQLGAFEFQTKPQRHKDTKVGTDAERNGPFRKNLTGPLRPASDGCSDLCVFVPLWFLLLLPPANTAPPATS